MSQQPPRRCKSDDLSLDERRRLIWDFVKKTQPPRDHAAWEREVAFMRKRAELPAGEPGGKRTWTRDDAYEERLSRYDRRSDSHRS